jgi:hypothetical protein
MTAGAGGRCLPRREGMQSQVRWGTADPTGHPHIVPGANATQWYWWPTYDITTASGDFLARLRRGQAGLRVRMPRRPQ